MPTRRWLPRPNLADGLLAVAVLAVEAFAAMREGVEGGGFGLPPTAWLVLVTGSAALLWRRQYPITVLGVVVGAYVAWHLAGHAGAPSLAVLTATYGVGRYVSAVRTSLAVVLAASVVFVVVGIFDGDATADLAFAATLIPFLPWYVGRRVTARHERLRLLESRAASLERERVAEIRHALDEERRSIARELHDVVAHRVSLMTVQAGAAQAVIDTDPARAAQAMSAVEEAGRAALDELRHLLDVLRPSEGEEPRAPAASLSDLAALARQMGEAGLPVSLDVEGLPAGLPARIDLSAFRIVQESLTNAFRHAGPGARAAVRVGVDGDDLRLEISDDGPGGSSWTGGSGRGLTGMRERAHLLGGSLEAGPGRDGGFRVEATIPLRGMRS